MKEQTVGKKDTNTYIYQLEASFYLQLKEEKEAISFGDLAKRYKGSLPDSLEMRFIKSKFPDIFFGFTRDALSHSGNKEKCISEGTNSIIDVSLYSAINISSFVQIFFPKAPMGIFMLTPS